MWGTTTSIIIKKLIIAKDSFRLNNQNGKTNQLKLYKKEIIIF